MQGIFNRRETINKEKVRAVKHVCMTSVRKHETRRKGGKTYNAWQAQEKRGQQVMR